jgi:hypothetical protein
MPATRKRTGMMTFMIFAERLSAPTGAIEKRKK